MYNLYNNPPNIINAVMIVAIIVCVWFYFYKKNQKKMLLIQSLFNHHERFLDSWIDIWRFELSKYSDRNCDYFYLLKLKISLACLDGSVQCASQDWLWTDPHVVLAKHQAVFIDNLDEFILSLDNHFSDNSYIQNLKRDFVTLLSEQKEILRDVELDIYKS